MKANFKKNTQGDYELGIYKIFKKLDEYGNQKDDGFGAWRVTYEDTDLGRVVEEWFQDFYTLRDAKAAVIAARTEEGV